MPRKRKASPKQPVQKAPAKQQKQDGQKAVSHDIVVPLDEGFHDDAMVYIDDDGIIYDASLNQTNIGGNNNKVCGSDPHTEQSVLIVNSSIVCSFFTKQETTRTSLILAGGVLAILVS
ncbi:MAG: hypothetical protein Q9204_007784 [Flavoplaca sp. TL-2023a]